MQQFVVFVDYLLYLDCNLRAVVLLIALSRLALWNGAAMGDLGPMGGVPHFNFVLVALMNHHKCFSVILI